MKKYNFWIIKNLFYLTLLIFLFNNCSNNTKQTYKDSFSKEKSINDSSNTIPTQREDSIDPWKYGQMILDNKAYPTDDAGTFTCIQQLYSKDERTRDYFFNVFLVILSKADGALGETIGEEIPEFMFQYPDYYLKKYSLLRPTDKEHFIFNLSSGFYFNYYFEDGKEIKIDSISNYYLKIRKKLKSRTCESDSIINELKTKSFDVVKSLVKQ
jgi:hypothetical protein